MLVRSCGLLIGIMSLIGSILFGGLIVLRITHEPYRIPSGSTLPNVRDGDHSCIPNDLEPGQCPEPHTLRNPVHYRRGLFNRSFGPLVVPPGQVFVMGDNRYDSLDSRCWGPLPVDHVRGRAAFIDWSAHEGRVRFSRLLQAVC